MKIYLFSIDPQRHVFYAEPVERDASEAVTPTGMRGWFETKRRKVQDALENSESSVGRRVRQAWHWLQQRTSPHETLLMNLRHAEKFELFHPSYMSETEARRAWRAHLKRQRARQVTWASVDAVLAVVSISLMWLPGPNILGWWFFYRAICHMLALVGARRGLDSMTEYTALSVLDEPLAGDEHIAHIAHRYELKNLKPFLERVTSKRTPLAAR